MQGAADPPGDGREAHRASHRSALSQHRLPQHLPAHLSPLHQLARGAQGVARLVRVPLDCAQSDRHHGHGHDEQRHMRHIRASVTGRRRRGRGAAFTARVSCRLVQPRAAAARLRLRLRPLPPTIHKRRARPAHVRQLH